MHWAKFSDYLSNFPTNDKNNAFYEPEKIETILPMHSDKWNAFKFASTCALTKCGFPLQNVVYTHAP